MAVGCLMSPAVGLAVCVLASMPVVELQTFLRRHW